MLKDEPRHVVVVGAGVAGAAAAYELRRRRPDVRVTVLEGSPRTGGKLAAVEVGGVRVDVGAEAMLARRPEAIGLARDVGLDIVHPATTSAGLWNRGRLVPLPRTVMGVPGSPDAVAGVLSARGQARLRLDAVLPATVVGDDVSVGDLVEQRLGREVVDRLVEPLLGGVYAGHAHELSARAATPQLLGLLTRERSLMKAATNTLAAPATDGPVFGGLAGGVAGLVPAVLAASGAAVRTNATVRELIRRPRGWRLVVGPTREPELVEADAVVLATPARPTARLLADVAPSAALALAEIEYASVAVVTLAARAEDLSGTTGSGFLVPPVDGHAIKAATYAFAKWDWVREAGEAHGVRLLRASLGRHREEATLQREDAELVALAVADLRAAAGLTGAPVDAHVQRWGGALPQYAVGHLDRVRRARDAVAAQPGLAVCGAAYDGLGIPACIASARTAVAKLTADLPSVADPGLEQSES